MVSKPDFGFKSQLYVGKVLIPRMSILRWLPLSKCTKFWITLKLFILPLIKKRRILAILFIATGIFKTWEFLLSQRKLLL